MKKYLIIKPFSLLEKSLLLQDDIVFAEEVRSMTHVYHPKTRKLLGKISTKEFTELVMEIPN
jgi:hypothetical protein